VAESLVHQLVRIDRASPRRPGSGTRAKHVLRLILLLMLMMLLLLLQLHL
jgi:hypothetical protein